MFINFYMIIFCVIIISQKMTRTSFVFGGMALKLMPCD